MPSEKKVTGPKLQQLRQDGTKIVALSVYDALMARLADAAGVHITLVGDSMGMTILGYKMTVSVTLQESLHHTAAVVRGVHHAMVIGDMPFLTYQVTPEDALRNAGRYIQEAGADGVKLEGGTSIAPTVKRLVDCGIPVLGHIGLLPQKVITAGGYRVHGRTEAEAAMLLEDARSLADAGACAIILEYIPAALSRKITSSINIPTIGIGAGPDCSGQIQVGHDILGMTPDWKPRHTRQYAQMGKDIQNVFSHFRDDVQRQDFPGPEESLA